MPPVKTIARRQMVRDHLLKDKMSQMDIARKLKVDKDTIRKDVKAIRNEILEEFQDKKKAQERVLTEMLTDYDDIYLKAEEIYKNSKHENIRTGALKIMQNHHDKRISILQTLGILNCNPVVVDAKIEIDYVGFKDKKTTKKEDEEDKDEKDNSST